MIQSNIDLVSRMNQGPAILLLGQDYLRLEYNEDPFLDALLRKFGGSESAEYQGYSRLLVGEAHRAPRTSLDWMYALCERLKIPEWLEAVARYPWSGIFTSAIDAVWPRAFRSNWREIEPIFEEKFVPADPRSRSNLHCTFLFGSVMRPDQGERPPLSESELSARRLTALRLADRLPQLVTPLGALLIEGYAGENDWLEPRDLEGLINQLDVDQAHLFSANDDLRRSRPIRSLSNSRKLVLHEEALAEFLDRYTENGDLKSAQRTRFPGYSRHVRIGDGSISIPLYIWSQVSAFALILDDVLTMPPPGKVGQDRLYQDFRTFLAESGSAPVWTGYHRNFAFRRGFEDELEHQVMSRLRDRDPQAGPVIVHGQTGTGKTIALGALAMAVRKKGEYPVIFIERKLQPPSYAAIEMFCQWAEEQDAPATLIVWDGMVESEAYDRLARYLSSRGRRATIVGSCYRLVWDTTDTAVEASDSDTNQILRSAEFIEAPATLAQDEKSRFTEFLNRFDTNLGLKLADWIAKDDPTFLVALYRLLTSSRPSLVSGVLREAAFAEQKIRRMVENQPPEPLTETALAFALWQAGLIEALRPSVLEQKESVDDEQVTRLQELVTLVMVAGRHGWPVPLELLMRAVGRGQGWQLWKILSELDIIQVNDKPHGSGNYVVEPRQQLEAQLYVQARLGAARTEVEYAKRLLLEVRQNDWVGGNREVDFAVNLIRSMGPNGDHKAYFSPYFRDLADALTELRQRRGIKNPRLMLQEANLLRESVILESAARQVSQETSAALDRAEQVLRDALDSLDAQHRDNPLRSYLLVELAATLAAEARHKIDYAMDRSEITHLYREARAQLFRAGSIQPADYHPLDVLAWTTFDLLKANVLNEHDRREAEADLLYAFDTADIEDFAVPQRILFLQRRAEIGSRLKLEELTEESFQKLVQMGSAAGYYLRARQKAGTPLEDYTASDEERRRYRDAVEYLKDNREQISQDSRCLNLLLRLWWMEKTGKAPFHGDRECVPFDTGEWRECLTLTTQLMEADPLNVPARLRFLEGLAVFHLGSVADALELFRQLEQESDYVQGGRRIIRSYLASNPDGSPRVFSGSVQFIDREGKRGRVFVNELRYHIPFFGSDFRRSDLRQGQSLTPFHVAFNFIGPIAEPVFLLKTRGGREL